MASDSSILDSSKFRKIKSLASILHGENHRIFLR